MSRTIAGALEDIPRKTLKYGEAAGEGEHKKVERPGAIIKKALFRAGIAQKSAALTMGISEGQLSRQLDDVENLSWQKLWDLDDDVWREVLVLIAETRGVARVRMQLDIERKVG